MNYYPSGTQRRWHNRVNWACYDMYRASLLNRPRRGHYIITELGREVLSQGWDRIDRSFLTQFESFADWINRSSNSSAQSEPGVSNPPDSLTPEEAIATANRRIQADLRDEVLQMVQGMNPYQFEVLVIDLLLAMGYGGSREEAGRVTQGSNDQGIDGVINEDRLGLDVIYIQAKRWQSSVGLREIQGFVGALAGQQAQKGIFITTSDFSQNAIAYARSVSQRVILIDGNRLADLMIEHNIGVTIANTVHIKRLDSDYFEVGN